jgi:hypothetical protein
MLGLVLILMATLFGQRPKLVFLLFLVLLLSVWIPLFFKEMHSRSSTLYRIQLPLHIGLFPISSMISMYLLHLFHVFLFLMYLDLQILLPTL